MSFLSSPCRYPIFENPYPLTIHESPVTCCEYFANCPAELIPALYSVGSRQKRQGYSKKVLSCWKMCVVMCGVGVAMGIMIINQKISHMVKGYIEYIGYIELIQKYL